MTPDRELLRQYAEQGDEAAFAEIVRRHVNWVYSTALRLVAGDSHLAQDVVQVVFSDCARKAARLSCYDAPGGWLHTATRFAAAKAVDREQRRRRREQEAFAMQTEPATPEICWEQLRPALDDAIGRLPDSDRAAVVMRFFENKSHREIGDLAGLSEDSARKRVERAVEKLRLQFARRGITVSAGLLAETIGANSVHAAPTGVAASVMTASLTQTAATGLGGVLSHVLSMTLKTKIILTVAALLAFAVAAIPFATSQRNSAPVQNTQANAPQRKSTPGQTPKSVSTVEAPRLPPQSSSVSPAPPAASSDNLTPAQKAMLTRQALAGGQPAPKFASTPPAQQSTSLNSIEQRVVDLLPSAPSSVNYQDMDIFELLPGMAGSYRIRSDVVIIPIPGVGSTFQNREHLIYYLPSANHFYIVWEGMGASTLHYHGPFEGNPYDMLGLPMPTGANP